MGAEGRFKVGFFPAFFNLGETQRLVRIAKCFREMGGEAVFFSHGGAYEWLAREAGFEVVRVEPVYTEEDVRRMMELEQSESMLNLIRAEPYPEEWLVEHVESEVEAYEEAGVVCVFMASNASSVISARAAGLPLFSIVPGTMIPPYFEAGYGSWPDQFESFLTRLLPRKLKDKLFNWIVLHEKFGVKTFNRVAKRFGVKPFKSSLDLVLGDVTLVTDYPEYLGLKPTREFPRENFVGPFSPLTTKPSREDLRRQREVIEFLESGNSVLISMGSSGCREIFKRAVVALEGEGYKVAGIYTSILKEEDLDELSGKALLVKWVPEIEKVYRAAKVLIIHGGENTVHAAAYSGRPVVGIPMQFEQQYNLEALVRHGVGIVVSRKFFNEDKLVKAVKAVFNNYKEYLERSRRLAANLPKPEGEKKSAARIYEVLRDRLHVKALS